MSWASPLRPPLLRLPLFPLRRRRRLRGTDPPGLGRFCRHVGDWALAAEIRRSASLWPPPLQEEVPPLRVSDSAAAAAAAAGQSPQRCFRSRLPLITWASNDVDLACQTSGVRDFVHTLTPAGWDGPRPAQRALAALSEDERRVALGGVHRNALAVLLYSLRFAERTTAQDASDALSIWDARYLPPMALLGAAHAAGFLADEARSNALLDHADHINLRQTVLGLLDRGSHCNPWSPPHFAFKLFYLTAADCRLGKCEKKVAAHRGAFLVAQFLYREQRVWADQTIEVMTAAGLDVLHRARVAYLAYFARHGLLDDRQHTLDEIERHGDALTPEDYHILLVDALGYNDALAALDYWLWRMRKIDNREPLPATYARMLDHFRMHRLKRRLKTELDYLYRAAPQRAIPRDLIAVRAAEAFVYDDAVPADRLMAEARLLLRTATPPNLWEDDMMAACNAGDGAKVENLWRTAVMKGVYPTQNMLFYLLMAKARYACRPDAPPGATCDIDDAEVVFDAIPSFGYLHRAEEFAEILDALLRCREYHRIPAKLKLLNKMKHAGLVYNSVLLNLTLRFANETRNKELFIATFNEMKTFNLMPTLRTVAAILDGCVLFGIGQDDFWLCVAEALQPEDPYASFSEDEARELLRALLRNLSRGSSCSASDVHSVWNLFVSSGAFWEARPAAPPLLERFRGTVAADEAVLVEYTRALARVGDWEAAARVVASDMPRAGVACPPADVVALFVKKREAAARLPEWRAAGTVLDHLMRRCPGALPAELRTALSRSPRSSEANVTKAKMETRRPRRDGKRS